MQHAVSAFPEGIHIPGLKPQRLAVQRHMDEVEIDLPEAKVRELSIVVQKQKGRK
jgi:hypothetical protein